MTHDRTHIEFYYDFGGLYYYHGSMSRTAFERLVSGDCGKYVQIDELCYWDEARQVFRKLEPSGGKPTTSSYFSRDRILRIWPVDVPESFRSPQPDPKGNGQNLRSRFAKFLGEDPKNAHFVTHDIAYSEIPNLGLAIDELNAETTSTHELLGFPEGDNYANVNLRRVISNDDAMETGPPQWRREKVGLEVYRDCLAKGIYLIDCRLGRFIIAVYLNESRYGNTIEVMALDSEVARTALDAIREGMSRLNIYRGKVITLKPPVNRVEFSAMDHPARTDLVLPESVLQLIDRSALGVLRHREALLEAGRHLKRGLLFHGPPGTGKTLTARYLAGALEGYTVILLSGPALGMVQEAFELARKLSPSALILEDVDLIAKERFENEYADVLHDLLDELEGLERRTELLCILTTNRPDVLEPALMSRPGRIDQAVEFPLPDFDGRVRLFRHFSKGLQLDADLESFVERTEGASGAFVEEMMRRSLIVACESGSKTIQSKHLEQALDELAFAGGDLTRNLLGFRAQE